MPARPYALVAASTLATVQRVLQGALDDCCRAWGIAPASLTLACARAWEAAAAQAWRQSHAEQDKTLHLGWNAGLALQLAHAMFGPDGAPAAAGGAPTLAQDTARQALAALVAALAGACKCGAAEPAPADPPAALFARGSGAVLVQVRVGGETLQCLLNDGAVCALAGISRVTPLALAKALPAVDFKAALTRVPVALPVHIGAADVALGSLLTLGVGDVIRLDTCADLPLTVHAPGGAALFGGYLGKADQSVALELVRRKQ